MKRRFFWNISRKLSSNIFLVGVTKSGGSIQLTPNGDFLRNILPRYIFEKGKWEIGESQIHILHEDYNSKVISHDETEYSIDEVLLVGLTENKDSGDLNNQYSKNPNFSRKTIRESIKTSITRSKNDETEFVYIVDDFGEFSVDVTRGIYGGLYEYLEYDIENDLKDSVIPLFPQDDFNKASILGDSQNKTRYMSDLPSNFCTPQIFCNFFQSNQENLEYKVRNRKWLEEKNFNAFLNVSRGSKNEPKLLQGKYKGKKNDEDVDLVLVGKGITFDTGGYCLKPSSNMWVMKRDMTGAAVCMNALDAIAKLKLPINVISLTPLCENMISGDAYLPGDVVECRNGKTVEIQNTDAEGRMILSDTLSYACDELSPNVLIDVATLTGAMDIALGDISGVFCTNSEIWDIYEEASLNVGEFSWRMPLVPKLVEKKLKSSVSDMKNCSQSSSAGSCVAAAFLGEFVECDNWIHVDIAGSAFVDDEMTGNTTSTIIEFAKILSDSI